MPHPRNKRERFLIGQRKGVVRATGEIQGYSPESRARYFERWAYLRRKTTKLCSCAMCGNPRRSSWNKDRRTMQEKKNHDRMSFQINDM